MATIGEGIRSAGASIGAGFAQAGQRRRIQEREDARTQAVIDAAALQRTQKLDDQARLSGNVEQIIRQKLGLPITQPEEPVSSATADVTDDATKVSEISKTGAPQVIAGVGFTPEMAKPFAKILAQNPQAFTQLISFLKTADNQKLAAVAKTTEQNLQMGTLLSKAKNKDQMDFMIKNIIETKPNLSEQQRDQLLRIQNDPDFDNRKLRLRRVISESRSTKDLLLEHNKVRAEGRALDVSETQRGRDAVLGVLTTVQSQTDPNVQVQMLEQGVADLKAQGLDARPLERIVAHPQRTLRLPNLISGTIGAFTPSAVTTSQLGRVKTPAEIAQQPAKTDIGKARQDLKSGLITQAEFDVIQTTPPDFQSKVGKLIGDKQAAISVFGENSEQVKAINEAISSEQKGEGPKLSDIGGVRKEFTNLSGDFIKLRDAIGKVEQNFKFPSAAGDLSMIFNFMKILDPGSVVRESEFATAQNAAGVPERIRAQWNRALRGERLSLVTRKDFFDTANRLFKNQEDRQIQLEKTFRRISKAQGIDPEKVVINFRTPKKGDKKGKTPASTKLSKMSDEELLGTF